jgi:hypothetical protein
MNLRTAANEHSPLSFLSHVEKGLLIIQEEETCLTGAQNGGQLKITDSLFSPSP